MSRLLTRALLCLCTVVTLTASTMAQQGGENELRISVHDVGGALVTDALVTVGDPAGTMSKARPLPDGTYVVDVAGQFATIEVEHDVHGPGVAKIELPIRSGVIAVDVTYRVGGVTARISGQSESTALPSITQSYAAARGGGVAGGDPACNDFAGDCCIANGTAGCNASVCCNLVCDLDPFCCNHTWDGLCADAAAANCPGLCGGGSDPDWLSRRQGFSRRNLIRR